MFEFVGVFFAMAALDYVWAHYTRNVTAGREWRASGYASLIVVFNAAVTLGYVQSAWSILPAAAGAFVGTFLSVKWDK